MSKFSVGVFIAYKLLYRMIYVVVYAENRVEASRLAMIDQLRHSSIEKLDKLAKSNGYSAFKEGEFIYNISSSAVEELEVIEVMIDGRTMDVLIPIANKALMKNKGLLKKKGLSGYSIDIKWTAERKIRDFNLVVWALNKKDAISKIMLSLSPSIHEWDGLDLFDKEGNNKISVASSEYEINEPEKMEFVDIAIKGGSVGVLLPMHYDDSDGPTLATYRMSNLKTTRS